MRTSVLVLWVGLCVAGCARRDSNSSGRAPSPPNPEFDQKWSSIAKEEVDVFYIEDDRGEGLMGNVRRARQGKNAPAAQARPAAPSGPPEKPSPEEVQQVIRQNLQGVRACYLRIAREGDFVAQLAERKRGLEIYLQFDSLERDALMNLRGADLRRVRQEALENLERHNISTTLVVTVKRGVNEHEIGRIVQHALGWRCVRGVTFQPVQDAGRNENFDPNRDRVLLSDIRRAVIRDSGVFGADDMIPLPCNPEQISIAYGLRNGRSVLPVTSMVPREELIAITPNTISFEKQPILKDKFIELFSLSSGPNNCAERLHEFLCCLPKVETPAALSYENVFRVAIIQFMDRFNFCVGGVKRSCIHFVTPNGQIIPFDTFNLFYRNGAIDKIRAALKAEAIA